MAKKILFTLQKSDGFEPNPLQVAVTDDSDDNRFAGIADAIGREAPRGRPVCSPSLPAMARNSPPQKPGEKERGITRQQKWRA
jgi:hypothetical protein